MTGLTAGFDLVTFRAGRYVGILIFGGLGSPDVSASFLAFAREAVAKAEGKHFAVPLTRQAEVALLSPTSLDLKVRRLLEHASSSRSSVASHVTYDDLADAVEKAFRSDS